MCVRFFVCVFVAAFGIYVFLFGARCFTVLLSVLLRLVWPLVLPNFRIVSIWRGTIASENVKRSQNQAQPGVAGCA